MTPREKREAYMNRVGYTKLSSSEREEKLINAIRYLQMTMLPLKNFYQTKRGNKVRQQKCLTQYRYIFNQKVSLRN